MQQRCGIGRSADQENRVPFVCAIARLGESNVGGFWIARMAVILCSVTTPFFWSNNDAMAMLENNSWEMHVSYSAYVT
jgi:hypothetical protein